MRDRSTPGRNAGDPVRWAPSSLRLDAPEPLIRPGRAVGLWRPPHLLAVPWHDHEFYELAFVIDGTGIHIADDREVEIRPGMVILVPPGVPHGYRMQHKAVVHNCFFRAEVPDFELLWASRDDALGTLFGRRHGAGRSTRGDVVIIQLDTETALECVAELEAIETSGAGMPSRAQEIGHLLLALDRITRHGRLDSGTRRAPRSALPRAVSIALETIERDLTKHWTLDALSREAFVSSFYLAHEFKRWVGVAPQAYANQLRAEGAALLLVSTDDAIAVVGESVGWPEPTAFSRHFREAFGTSPRAYRRRTRMPLGAPVADAP
jgi:AraC family L-rhamnose operon transcriptional activator RhaR